MKKFAVGNTYTSACWFTGGVVRYTVKSRTENTVTLFEHTSELDGEHDCEPETYEIHCEDEREYIVIYSYRGHGKMIYA